MSEQETLVKAIDLTHELARVLAENPQLDLDSKNRANSALINLLAVLYSRSNEIKYATPVDNPLAGLQSEQSM